MGKLKKIKQLHHLCQNNLLIWLVLPVSLIYYYQYYYP